MKKLFKVTIVTNGLRDFTYVSNQTRDLAIAVTMRRMAEEYVELDWKMIRILDVIIEEVI